MKLSFGQLLKLTAQEPAGKRALITSGIFLVVCIISSVFMHNTKYGNAIMIGSALAFSFQFQTFMKVFAAMQQFYEEEDQQ